MDSLGWLPFLLAGLAFFFLGLDAIKDSLRGLASRSMRVRAAAAVGSPFRAALLGVSFGAVSQSATAVSFVLAGLVTAGLLPARRALSVVAWANPGTALLAYLAAVNLELATLWLIGLVGLSLRSSRVQPFKAGLHAMLGVGLLLFGLVEIKRAASPIQGAEWFAALTTALQSWMPLCFLLGALLRKRGRLVGTTLRNRSDEYKAALVARFREEALPLLESGALRAVVHAEFPLERTGEAHALMESNATLGKILLRVSGEL